MSDLICTICGHHNVIPVLVGRDDREYGVSSRLNYYRCISVACLHVQARPVPNHEVIASFYVNYTTHGVYTPHGLGRIVNYISEVIAVRQLGFLRTDNYNIESTRILDFGCGNGNNLRRLAKYGYHDLVGYDFDPLASACVSEQGFICYSNWDDLLKGNKYDVVFLNHVIEHLPNPHSVVCDILALIRPRGLLVIRTPNAGSSLARMCGVNWRGWETPRHLNLFTHSSLCCLLNDISECQIVQKTTSNDMLIPIATSSISGILKKYKSIKIFIALALTVTSLILKTFLSNSGEELVFKIRKH